MGFQNNVKRLREEKGFTQAELGELVGVVQQVIADYEGGKRNAKRIVFSDDGLIFYTPDHYNSFEQLYGEEQ